MLGSGFHNPNVWLHIYFSHNVRLVKELEKVMGSESTKCVAAGQVSGSRILYQEEPQVL